MCPNIELLLFFVIDLTISFCREMVREIYLYITPQGVDFE